MTSIWENASNLRSMQLPKVREKLSSLVRRGSTRKLRATATGHDGVPTVAPVLEVDLTRVESFRLAEGWLEDPNVEPPPSPPRRNGPNRRKPEPAQRYSTTPIADLFSMSTDQLASMLETVARKPVPAPAPRVVPETWSVAPLSSTTTAPAAARVAPSRPKTIRQRESIPDASVAPLDLQPIRISLRHSTVLDAVVTPEATSSTQSRRRTVMSWSNDVPAGPPTSSTPEESSSQRHSVRETSLLRSVGPNTTGLRVTGGGTGGGGSNDGTKRFSMPAMQPPPPCANRLPIPETKTPRPTPRNASMPTPTTSTPTLAPSSTTEVRRRSWQPAAAPAPAVQGAAAGSMRRRTPSTRPPTAAPTASRLAWIRALESKSSSASGTTPRSEPQRLGGPKKQPSGGVAGKLAMFEQMQAPASSISRSNSTTSSRVSSGTAMTDSGVFAAGSAASVVGGDYYPPPSTARTSMDSTRSSYRHSAVMAYYDEEFRERMEGVAGGLSKQANKGEESESASGMRKVTAQLVEVARGKDQPREVGAADMSAEDLAKEVQFEERVEEQQVVAPANDDVQPAKQELPETLELPPVLAEELSAGGVKVDSSTPLQIDMSEAQQLAGSSDDVALATTAIGVDEPEAPQPSSTSDEDASATAATELTRADSEAGKTTAENPPSPDAGPVEREHSLMIFEELAENPAQGNIEIAAREEAVEVQTVSGEQDHESAQGCSSVVGKDDAGVAVELVVKQQDAAGPGVEAEQ